MSPETETTPEAEISSEERMRRSDAVLVERHEHVVTRLKATTPDRTLLEETRLIGAVALTARRVHGLLGADDRRKQARTLAQLRANRAAVEVSAAKGRARKVLAASPAAHAFANENAAAPQQEMDMDDDSGRTPERMAEIHAEIGRRLGLARAGRESKRLDQGGAVPDGRALPGGVETKGQAPASPD